MNSNTETDMPSCVFAQVFDRTFVRQSLSCVLCSPNNYCTNSDVMAQLTGELAYKRRGVLVLQHPNELYDRVHAIRILTLLRLMHNVEISMETLYDYLNGYKDMPEDMYAMMEEAERLLGEHVHDYAMNSHTNFPGNMRFLINRSNLHASAFGGPPIDTVIVSGLEGFIEDDSEKLTVDQGRALASYLRSAITRCKDANVASIISCPSWDSPSRSVLSYTKTPLYRYFGSMPDMVCRVSELDAGEEHGSRLRCTQYLSVYDVSEDETCSQKIKYHRSNSLYSWIPNN